MALTNQYVTVSAMNLIERLRTKFKPADIPTVLAAALCQAVAGRAGSEDNAHVLVTEWWETHKQEAEYDPVTDQ